MPDRFLDGNTANNLDSVCPNLPGLHLGPTCDLTATLQGRHGGDFAGIIQKLKSGYFKNMGITVIWLNPIARQSNVYGGNPGFPLKTGYHGYNVDYDPANPDAIDPNLGTVAEYKQIVQLAHQQGIKIVQDVVLEGTGFQSSLLSDNPSWFTPSACFFGGMSFRRCFCLL